MNFELTKEEKETRNLLYVLSIILATIAGICYVTLSVFLTTVFNTPQYLVLTSIINYLIFTGLGILIDNQLIKYWKEPYHKRLDKELNEHLNSEYYGN